jgi:hypothetical protein
MSCQVIVMILKMAAEFALTLILMPYWPLSAKYLEKNGFYCRQNNISETVTRTLFPISRKF